MRFIMAVTIKCQIQKMGADNQSSPGMVTRSEMKASDFQAVYLRLLFCNHSITNKAKVELS